MSMRVTMVTVLMGSNGQSLWPSLNVNSRLDPVLSLALGKSSFLYFK